MAAPRPPVHRRLRRPGAPAWAGPGVFAGWLVLAAFAPAAGQSPGPAAAERDRGWVTWGVGPSTPYDLSGGFTLNFGRTGVVQLASHGAGDLTFWGKAPGVAAASASLGLSRVDRWTRMAAFAGPALVWWTGRGESGGPADRRLAGAVVSAQAIVTPVPEMGVGIELFGILNHRQSAAGLTLLLVFEGNK